MYDLKTQKFLLTKGIMKNTPTRFRNIFYDISHIFLTNRIKLTKNGIYTNGMYE